MFCIIDYLNYLHAPKPVRAKTAEVPDRLRFDGLSNLLFLTLILGAVFISDPPIVREGLMALAALGSYFTTRKSVHEANHFNFHPIQEVAILFIGIFATMIPALDWLETNAAKMGNPSPVFFYWGSGLLSSVLDNAPTYLSFLYAIFGAFVNQDTLKTVQDLVQNGGVDLASVSEPVRQTYLALQKYHFAHVASKNIGAEEIQVAYLLGNASFNNYLLAISIGAVFFGANTYIGNGPNFMVKAIADHNKVHTPSFLGFVFKYTLPYMMPMLIIVSWLFFRS